MNLILGVDFDNTLVNYDEVFWKTARQFGFITDGVIRHKKDVRDLIRRLAGGEIKWQKIQAHVYGKAMGGAVLIDGASEFFKACRSLGASAYIISHKAKFAAQDTEKIDLRKTALDWMRQKDFFEVAGLGFSPDQVFFEPTREDKIKRIKKLGCTHFIDDLEETFIEASFPQDVEKILYDPHAENFLASDMKIFRNWTAIKQHFMGIKQYA